MFSPSENGMTAIPGIAICTAEDFFCCDLVSKCVGIRQGSWETKEIEGAALSPTGCWGGDTKAQGTTEAEHKNIHSTHTHTHMRTRAHTHTCACARAHTYTHTQT